VGFLNIGTALDWNVTRSVRSSGMSELVGLNDWGLGIDAGIHRPVCKTPLLGLALPMRMAGRDRKSGNGGASSGTGIATRVKPKTKKPSLYRVLLLNDDFTPMEFVVHVLERFFSKSGEQATRIMLHVHNHGVGECGIFTFEVAETKVTQVMDFARKHQHPLQCVMEKK
jgi:ATP-dependent Clp protease adaptor protein ClpS